MKFTQRSDHHYAVIVNNAFPCNGPPFPLNSFVNVKQQDVNDICNKKHLITDFFVFSVLDPFFKTAYTDSMVARVSYLPAVRSFKITDARSHLSVPQEDFIFSYKLAGC